LSPESVRDLSAELNVLLDDVFSLYIKTKNLHWHISGPHFRAYRLLLNEHAGQIVAMTDDIAKRVLVGQNNPMTLTRVLLPNDHPLLPERHAL
jgi:DNA-binding ferritin-like protein